MGAEFKIQGRVAKDPDIRSGTKGNYCFLRVEVVDGKFRTWLNVACFGEQADAADQFHEGDDIEARGRINSRKNAEGKYETQLVAEVIRFPQRAPRPAPQRQAPRPAPQPEPARVFLRAPVRDEPPPPTDEDLGF